MASAVPANILLTGHEDPVRIRGARFTGLGDGLFSPDVVAVRRGVVGLGPQLGLEVRACRAWPLLLLLPYRDGFVAEQDLLHGHPQAADHAAEAAAGGLDLHRAAHDGDVEVVVVVKVNAGPRGPLEAPAMTTRGTTRQNNGDDGGCLRQQGGGDGPRKAMTRTSSSSPPPGTAHEQRQWRQSAGAAGHSPYRTRRKRGKSQLLNVAPQVDGPRLA
eukprot:CAMPEP_0118857100 /NCGR_PEP_ID=MMETSP1163-20130328/4341_1 /TAXON_ID=124430 /ORGANISM="Phaeomonas parva, Strain CCMP2877" /LENGTH=215 /DNA_ID=CAMNT_0006790353 /DNA_START=555 /DNA_END=1200 /DNA_ORIENTATION=-